MPVVDRNSLWSLPISPPLLHVSENVHGHQSFGISLYMAIVVTTVDNFIVDPCQVVLALDAVGSPGEGEGSGEVVRVPLRHQATVCDQSYGRCGKVCHRGRWRNGFKSGSGYFRLEGKTLELGQKHLRQPLGCGLVHELGI